jgi:deoxyribodipyrimidine photo-lyase
MTSKQEISIFWFRRDLRIEDNAGLYHSLKNNERVLPLFIFDTDILEQLENKKDKRVEFIHLALLELQKTISESGSSLLILKGNTLEIFTDLIKKYTVKNIYTNTDYEPSAIERDLKIESLAKKNDIAFYSFKDQVIFEKGEILKDDGLPYTIFTPFMRKWKAKLNSYYLKPYPTKKYISKFFKTNIISIPTLKEIGFIETGITFSVPAVNEKVISGYHETRNFPATEGTSRLSVHLRFGTISIRQLASKAQSLNDQWLNELIWREFYMVILFHFPHVVTRSFKKQYDNIKWLNNEEQFERWCKGETGYPIVDAGMRELNATGFMHNRVRMITASFLVKHLLIDWRWGEAYFAEKLMDYDLSANNGGWQWAASSGCDAAPYFRVFSPDAQTLRFDSKFEYIRKWVPEFEELTYPKPIVDHKFARERVLATFKKALEKK